MSESFPFLDELLALDESLGGGFGSDVFWNVKTSDSSVNLKVSFSSSGLENPVVWMKTELNQIYD